MVDTPPRQLHQSTKTGQCSVAHLIGKEEMLPNTPRVLRLLSSFRLDVAGVGPTVSITCLRRSPHHGQVSLPTLFCPLKRRLSYFSLDKEQLRLMDADQCILVNKKDQIIGKESKRNCNCHTHSPTFS